MGFSTTDKLEEILADIVEHNNVLTVQWVKSHYADDFEHGLSADVAIVNALLAIGCKQRRTKNCRYYYAHWFESGLNLDSPAKRAWGVYAWR